MQPKLAFLIPVYLNTEDYRLNEKILTAEFDNQIKTKVMGLSI